MSANDFHLAEYSSLREELLEKSRNIDQMLRLMIVVVPGLLAWILTTGTSSGLATQVVSAWLPAAVSVFVLRHRKDNIAAIKKLAIYIRKVEDAFAEEGLGWERLRTAEQITMGRNSFRSTKSLIWATVSATSLFGILKTLIAFGYMTFLQF